MMSNDIDTLILDAATRLFRDTADLQTAVLSGGDDYYASLWNGIEETGLGLAAVPEELGGAGAGLRASLGMLRAAGNVALSVPLAETILANWMLAQAGIDAQAGKLTCGPAGFNDALTVDDEGRLSGRIVRMPFARDCEKAALLVRKDGQLSVALVDMANATITARDSIAFEPCDMVEFDQVVPLEMAPAPAGFTEDTSLLMGSAARSVQIAGALEEMLKLTTEYVQERPAFNRTLSKFQVVQHALAQMAGEVSASLSVAASAVDALDTLLAEGRGFDDPELRLEVMSAKIRTSGAAKEGSRIAHQMHGAIGVTDEHVLHRLTLRALAWRDDYGNETQWADVLGAMVRQGDGDALWALLSKR